MSGEAKYSLLVLWEHEIRTAATLFEKATRLLGDESASNDARQTACAEAYEAARAALWGADDEERALVLSSAPKSIRSKKGKSR